MNNEVHQDTNLHENLKYEQVAKAIAHKIFNKEFENNALPKESEMQEIFEVGRSIIRDAMKILKSKGLIITKTKVGTVICPMRNWDYLDSQLLEWLMETRMRKEVFDYFLGLRKLIEPKASSLSAILLSDEQIEELKSMWNTMEEMAVNFHNETWVACYMKFHEMIYKGSKNLLFVASIDIYKAVWLSRLANVSSYCEVCYKRHKDLYQAIIDRNPRRAKYASIMYLKHLEHGRETHRVLSNANKPPYDHGQPSHDHDHDKPME